MWCQINMIISPFKFSHFSDYIQEYFENYFSFVENLLESRRKTDCLYLISNYLCIVNE